LKITPRNILRHEIIGLEIEVAGSTNSSLKGIKGVVIDETMKTLLIETSTGRRVRVPKSTCDFIFRLPDGTRVLVEGRYLVGRPEDRLKRRLKDW